MSLKYENDKLFSSHGMKRLKDGYMRDDEISPQERFRFVADSFGSNKEHADRIYGYASDLWLSFSTPLLAYGKNKNALPISCFLSSVEDSKESLLSKSTETRMLSMLGGGIGLGFGIRPRGQKSTGVFPHIKTYDADTIAWKQGSTRRGAIAAYLDIDHPEIQEFISVRDPFGGDANRKSLNIHHGINLTDDFMNRVEQLSTRNDLTKSEVEELDKYPLSHPSSSKVDYGSVKQLWQSIIETRIATGEPYCHFIDTVNFSLPEFQKALGLKVTQSNLCLTGDTLIEIQYKGIDYVYRLDNFTEMFTLGFFGESVNVRSYNIQNDAVEYKPITAAAKTAEVDELYEIEDIETGRVIRCTAYHKIYTQNRGYVMAKDIEETDVLNISDRERNIIFTVGGLKIRKVVLQEKIPVYDITVEDNHNFYANGVLVHNCAEINLATGTDYTGINRTAVCCLSSLNLAKWDEWKDHPTFVQDVVEMLDNVLDVFIKEGSKIPEIADAVHSAKQERAIGIGALGWHDLLQSKMISFESPMAVGLNKRIFKHIKEKATEATQQLAIERGPCPDFVEYKNRNPDTTIVAVRGSHLLSVAPNASSSLILNTSPSIEPIRANIYREEGSSGVFMKRNKHIEALLESKGKNTQETWTDIMAHDGSVQHLKCLESYEKDVFKTAIEIDQKWVLQHAADRQEYICQSQSLNLFFSPTASIEYISYLHLLAWKMKIKTLYYFRSDTVSKAAKLGKTIEREKIAQLKDLVSSDDVCVACEG